MKILVVFIDMIRPNRLSLFNEEIKKETPLDKSLDKLGGTFYTNCFTEGPDTPRGLATFATGKIPYENGCDTRVKWPRYFLNKEISTIYDLCIEKDYKMSMFSNPNERETGMYPDHISSMDIHNNDYDLDNYLSKIELEENHFVFVGLPDYHWSFDDNGYSTYGENKAYADTKKSYDVIFENFDKDDFDHIFVFSDHGFKFTYEFKKQPKYMLLNEDRTNILMIHRKKGENSINYNENLCGLSDFFPNFSNLIQEKEQKRIDFFPKNQKNYILIEDHLDFAPTVNQNIGIWSIVKKDIIYIRTLENGYLLDRKSRKINITIDEEYDNILKNESSFSKYINEYEKVFKYREFIFKQSTFMHGGKRNSMSKIIKNLYVLKDLILEKCSNGK